MRIVCISDTHNQLKNISIPDGDILIHAGDLTMGGILKEVARELHYLDMLPHKHKVLVAGNHDWLFQRDRATAKSLIANTSITYLEDNEALVNGLRIYGSPWQPRFYDWAFNADEHELEAIWSRMLTGVDIVVTHGPPFGVGDLLVDGRRVGCRHLATNVARVRPKLHVFGHIHYARGVYSADGIEYVNASCVGEDYRVSGTAIATEL